MSALFLDVDTQIDFLFPAGALYVPGAERIVPTIAKLNRFAMDNGIPLISTVDAHLENDAEFRVWPGHCVAGTLSQRKPDCTLVGQIVLNKQTTNCFEHPELTGILDGTGADNAFVYGVATEVCVRHALFGMLRTGRRATLVTDAIQGLDESAAAQMITQFTAEGGELATAESACYAAASGGNGTSLASRQSRSS